MIEDNLMVGGDLGVQVNSGKVLKVRERTSYSEIDIHVGKDFGDHDAVREASQGSGSMMVLGGQIGSWRSGNPDQEERAVKTS
ncbi:hypothetical protein SLA2020_444020 [Shorea laevis]